MVSGVGIRLNCKSDAAVAPDNTSNRYGVCRPFLTVHFWCALYLRRMTGIGAKLTFQLCSDMECESNVGARK